MTDRPNILLILTDQQRFDIVGANGSPVCRTPSLDGLASGGVNFSNAYSHCPLCTPTRASIYSGRASHNHGLTRNTEGNTPNAPSIGTPEVPSLAQVLQTAGYRSAFLGKWHAGSRLPSECGFEGMDIEGYGEISRAPSYLEYLQDRGLEVPRIEPVGAGYPHHLLLAGITSGPVEASVSYFLAERAIETLEEQAQESAPSFTALNFWGPHAPYLPSEPYASMYDPRDIPPWPNFADDYVGRPPLYRRHHDSFVGEGNPTRTWEECARWAALYFGFMTQIDHHIGRVLAALEDLGTTENTAVLYSTDHGDLCGSHGGMHDKNSLMVEELMHIPMMARLPGVTKPGSRAKDLVSNLDIPATIADIATGKVPESFDGHSLLPILRGESAGEERDFVAAECYGVHFAYETKMIVHRNHKYVFHPGAFDELYDLREDPGEMRNLVDSPSHEGVLRECRRRLLRWMRQTRDPSHRAFFLFTRRLEYSPDRVVGYGPHAGDIYFDRELPLGGDPGG